MNDSELRLAVRLHFEMGMDEDHAGCPFSDMDSAKVAAESYKQSAANWATFRGIMSKAGSPIPDDFNWNNHSDMIQ